jgi:hypothetical protein
VVIGTDYIGSCKSNYHTITPECAYSTNALPISAVFKKINSTNENILEYQFFKTKMEECVEMTLMTPLLSNVNRDTTLLLGSLTLVLNINFKDLLNRN